MKKSIAILISVLIIIGLIPLFSSAAEIIDSGKCGDSGTWTIDNNGLLTISGNGKISEFPWDYSNYRHTIKTVILEEGITTIDVGLIPNIAKEVIIPSTVSEIIGTFYYNIYLERFIVSDANPYFSTDKNGIIYNKDFTELVSYPRALDISDFTIPDSVTKLSASFGNCQNLKTLRIGKNLEKDTDFPEYYGFWSFGIYSSSLQQIIVDEENKSLYSDEHGVLYNKDKTALIAYPPESKQASYVIPEGVTTIASSTFHSNKNLKNITLPKSLKTIGWGCFSESSLTEIYLPENVSDIYSYAFADCVYLKKIVVAEENEHYCSDSYGVLFNKNQTTLIQYPSASELLVYSIPETVINMDSEAIFSAKNLQAIVMPVSLNPGMIGGCNFYYCHALTDIFYKGNSEEFISTIESYLKAAYLDNVTIHSDFDEENLPEFTTKAPETTTEPTTKKPESTTHATYMQGDVNNDGRITAADARIILRASAKLETLEGDSLLAADIIKDSKITAADARKVLRISAKLE